MKNLNFVFVLLLLFIATIVSGQPAWERVTPLPQEHTINHITKIPGTNKLIAVGEASTVMISDDNGDTWEILTCPVDNSMKQIKIPGEQLKPGIYFYQLKTDDGASETKKMIKL